MSITRKNQELLTGSEKKDPLHTLRESIRNLAIQEDSTDTLEGLSGNLQLLVSSLQQALGEAGSHDDGDDDYEGVVSDLEQCNTLLSKCGIEIKVKED